MKRVLIAYYSATGTTAKMAEYIAEGVRFHGHDVAVREIGEIKNSAEIAGYDGYIFGSPTYSLDVPGPMKAFLSETSKLDLEGKSGGTFGSYTHDVGYKHDAHAPAILLDTLQRDLKMKPFELGPFILKEATFKTGEGIKACHDYGKVFGEKLGGQE